MNSLAVVTVKFFVGQDKERSLVKLYDKIMSNMNIAPAGASQPLVKPIDVDDVPIVAITLSPASGSGYDPDVIHPPNWRVCFPLVQLTSSTKLWTGTFVNADEVNPAPKG